MSTFACSCSSRCIVGQCACPCHQFDRAPISEATRERLARAVSCAKDSHVIGGEHFALDCGCFDCCESIVDAIVAALIAEGWRNLRDVVADDEAQTSMGQA